MAIGLKIAAARDAADEIIKDLSDRRGFRQAWEQCDAENQDEIRSAWTGLIAGIMATPSPAAPPPRPPPCADLDVFVDGELDAPSAAAFRAHLPDCAPCQAGLEGRLQFDAIAARAVAKAKAARQAPFDVKLARRVVLGVHRRITAALNAATDAALEEWLSGAPAESAPPPLPAAVRECAGCDPSGALCPGHPVAPPPPPVEGLGLAEAARKAADALVTAQTIARVAHDSKHEDFFAAAWMALRRALDAEEALAKARRKAAEVILADREIVFGTKEIQAAVMRWARAELGSAP